MSGNIKVRKVKISEEMVGQRIDNFLLKQLKGVPKSKIYKLIRKGEVRVNKGRIKPLYKLCMGDEVRIPPVRVSESDIVIPGKSVQEIIESNIIFEDESYLAVNKPSGLAVHGGSGISFGLIEGLRASRPNAPFLELIHRLDRDTSGCILIAKKRSRLREIHELIRENKVEKKYLLLVSGKWSKRKTRVDLPLKKSVLSGGERYVKVSPEGKESITDFRIIESFNNSSPIESTPIEATLIEAILQTGRTHQIRVHTSHNSHPIIGDTKYGDKEVNSKFKEVGLKRLFLHAHMLEFVLPSSGKKYCIEAGLPDELEKVVTKLRKNS